MKKFTPLRESMNMGPVNPSYMYLGDARESTASKNRGMSSSIYSSSKKLNSHANTIQKRTIKPHQVSSSLLNPIGQSKTQKKMTSLQVDEIQMFDAPLDSAENRAKANKRLGQPKSALKPRSIMKSPGTATKKVKPPMIMGRAQVDIKPKWNASGSSQAYQEFDPGARYKNNYVQDNIKHNYVPENLGGQYEQRKSKIREYVRSEIPVSENVDQSALSRAPFEAVGLKKSSQVSILTETRNSRIDLQPYEVGSTSQSEFKKPRKSRQMRSTRTSIESAILPVSLRQRADVSAQMDDKVQTHQDQFVKKIMEKEELKKKKKLDDGEDTTQTQYFQMHEAPSSRSNMRSISSNVATREQRKQMFLNQQKLLDAEQKLEQVEQEKEELETLRKLEIVNLRDKQRKLKQREQSEARRLEKFKQKQETIQPVESNIDFADEESKQLEIIDNEQTLPAASTSTAQISRQEKRKQYLAQQKLLDQLEKAEELEKQVKDTEFIRNKERIMEINRRSNSRSLGKSQSRRFKKQHVEVERLPIQEIEVKLQSVDFEDFDLQRYDPEIIQVVKQPSSATSTGGQGIQGIDREQLAIIKKKQRDQARAISDLEIEKEEQQVYKDISVREKSVSKLKMSQSKSSERVSRQQQQSATNYYQTYQNIDTIGSQPFSIQEENLPTESDIADEMQANIQTINHDYTTNQMTNQERFLTAGLSSNGQLTSDRSNMALVSVSDISKPSKKRSIKKKMTSPVKTSPNKANLIQSIEVQSPSKKLSAIKSKPSRPTPPAVTIGKSPTGKKSALGSASATKLTKSPSKKVIKKA